MTITDAHTTLVLAELETGFRTDSRRLEQLGRELTVAFDAARHFGERQSSAVGWNSAWRSKWDEVDRIVRRISARVHQIEVLIGGDDAERLKQAMSVWEAAQEQDIRLAQVLGGIRLQAASLDPAARSEWNQLARPIEVQLETIHACAQSLRVRLELLRDNSEEELDHLVRGIFSVPCAFAPADDAAAEPHDRDFREASEQLDREQHGFKGFLDVVKGLLLWVETPEERMRKNRSLTVETT